MKPQATWDVEVVAADVKLLPLRAVARSEGPAVLFGAVRDEQDRTLLWSEQPPGTATLRTVADRGVLSDAALDGQAQLHMIFDAPLSYAVTSGAPGGATKAQAKAIRQDAESDEAASLAVDAQGIPHVCYVATNGGQRRLVLAKREDDRWPTQTLTAPPGACRLAFGPDGSLHLVSAGSGVHYGVRRGTTWSFASVDPAPGSHGSSLAITASGNAVVTWVGGGKAHVARHQNGAWTREDLGSDVVGWRAPVVVDDGGTLHLAYHERRRVTDESGKPLLDASTVVHAHHDGQRWVEQDVAESRAHGIAIGAKGGQPHLFYFDPIREWLLHAAQRGPDGCEPGRVRQASACCWPGQSAAGGSCSGTPACPEGFLRDASAGCQALPRDIAFGAVACTKIHINGTIDLGAQKACRLAATHELGPRYFRERCDAGHADDCYVLGALNDQLVTEQSAYVLMPLCDTICRHARQSWGGNPIVEGGEDAAKALVAYRRACELGHGDACARVADLTDRDDERRARLVSLCTEGRRQAMCSRAVNEAPEIAAIAAVAKTLASLCDEGNAAACGDLGVLTENGEGVKADVDAALKLYARGCEGKHLPTCRSVAYAAANHPDRRGQLAAAGKTAVPALKAACDGGDPGACHSLAVCHHLGFATARDAKRADALFEQACKKGGSLLCKRP